MKLWYVYVDWTTESHLRPFYVGKGDQERVRTHAPTSRNEVHLRISRKYGMHRTVVFETFDEKKAYLVERLLIRIHKTYMHGGPGWWGANLDLGGEGGLSTPKTPAHREKIRQFMRTRTGEKNTFFGKQHRPDTIERISASMRGELGPCYGRTGESHPMFGTHHTPEARQKMSAAHAHKPWSTKQREARSISDAKRSEPTRQRNALIIKMIDEGMSRSAVARVLSLPINIVYGAVHRHNVSRRRNAQVLEELCVVSSEGR